MLVHSFQLSSHQFSGKNLLTKGQIISKGLLVSSNSPKKRTNEFIFTTMMNSFVRILGEFEDTKKSFRNYLTFTSYFFKIFILDAKLTCNYRIAVSLILRVTKGYLLLANHFITKVHS